MGRGRRAAVAVGLLIGVGSLVMGPAAPASAAEGCVAVDFAGSGADCDHTFERSGGYTCLAVEGCTIIRQRGTQTSTIYADFGERDLSKQFFSAGDTGTINVSRGVGTIGDPF